MESTLKKHSKVIPTIIALYFRMKYRQPTLCASQQATTVRLATTRLVTRPSVHSRLASPCPQLCRQC